MGSNVVDSWDHFYEVQTRTEKGKKNDGFTELKNVPLQHKANFPFLFVRS